MENQYTENGYNITTDPNLQNIRYNISAEFRIQLDQLCTEAQDKKNKKIIEKLNQLIIQYPNVPILKNYLSVAYNIQGNFKKSLEVNDNILNTHPDYLFALTNKANNYINKKEYSKVLELLGESLDIKALYPERDLFHLAEIVSFYRVVIRYYAAIENLEMAENSFEFLRKIAPDHFETDQAESYLFGLRLEQARLRNREEYKKKIIPKPTKLIPVSKKISAPNFNHSEIFDLYHFGIKIPHEKLKKIIELPHDSLVKDLEKILEDAVERYEYFSTLEWKDETHNFVLHALFLLKEINAVESLPKIISFLNYEEELIEFWVNDHITESLWRIFYVLGFNQTEMLKEFLLTPGSETYCKAAASEALNQMTLQHPEKRNEILAVFSDVFTAFLNATPEDNLIDSDFLGLSICDVIDSNLIELLPIIKELFDKNYVSLSITGNFKDVEKAFNKSSTRDHKRKISNIFEYYTEILNTWSGYKEDEEEISNFYIPQQAVSENIGRNDPCPCGSGKKYKKCCLGN